MKHDLPKEILFSSGLQYEKCKDDTSFWGPIVREVLRRHHLNQNNSQIIAGFNSTYPVFSTNDLIVKFFGYRTLWQETFLNECAAHQCLAQDARICVPALMASGQLFENTTMPWPYTISTKMAGSSWLVSDLSYHQQKTIAVELGQQLQYIHALPIKQALKDDKSWQNLDLKVAARQSSLPEHLIDQIDHFMTKLAPFNRVFVNGDIVSMHVFVKHGHLSGIIDWGDAVVTDRHYEIGKLCLSLFPCDKVLLTLLLEAANWPHTLNFPIQSLGLALYRQAVGLTQHRCFDVFYQLPIDLGIIATLEDLAHILFNVDQ